VGFEGLLIYMGTNDTWDNVYTQTKHGGQGDNGDGILGGSCTVTWERGSFWEREVGALFGWASGDLVLSAGRSARRVEKK
jgi:hypothetical protein